MLNQSKKEKAKKTMMTIQSTQSFSPIQDVSEGIIITKDRRFIKILEISPINFLLRSEDEKRDIIANFDATLRIMPVTIQFKVISRKTDVTRLIKGIEKDIETEQNKNCRTLQKEQIDLIKSVSSKEGVSRRFFIIFEYSESVGLKKTPSFYEIKADLDTTALFKICYLDAVTKLCRLKMMKTYVKFFIQLWQNPKVRRNHLKHE